MESRYWSSNGWVIFAALVLFIGGVFMFIEGLAFVANDDWSVLEEDDSLAYGLTFWGWVLIIGGIVQVLSAIGVVGGRLWGRALGVFIASIAGLLNLLTVPIYPLWSIIFIVLCFLVVFALVVHGDDIAVESDFDTPQANP